MSETVPLREYAESNDAVVNWNSASNSATVVYNDKKAIVYNNVTNGKIKVITDSSSIYVNGEIVNGKIFIDEIFLKYYFGFTEMESKIYPLSKGWTCRIDSPRGGVGQKHIHIYKNGESYSQNTDGSPHDGNIGKPPKKVREEAEDKTGWNWDEKEESYKEKQSEKNKQPNKIKYPNSDFPRVPSLPPAPTIPIPMPA